MTDAGIPQSKESLLQGRSNFFQQDNDLILSVS